VRSAQCRAEKKLKIAVESQGSEYKRIFSYLRWVMVRFLSLLMGQ
jgi:hypothetical protein